MDGASSHGRGASIGGKRARCLSPEKPRGLHLNIIQRRKVSFTSASGRFITSSYISIALKYTERSAKNVHCFTIRDNFVGNVQSSTRGEGVTSLLLYEGEI